MAKEAPPGTIARIVALCDEQAVAERQLRSALVDELRRSVPFDWYAWLLTDPETEVGSAPLADTPRWPICCD